MRYISLIVITLLSAACKKDKPESENTASLKHGLLVLNEGLFQLNNSSMTWLDTDAGTANASFFEEKAGRKLGDTGNDIQRYGGKVYVVVNVSSTVEVLDATSGASIKQISFIENNTAKQPRSIAFYGPHAFVSCFDGYVDVIDTVSLSVVQRIAVGKNPDHLISANNKIYVSNSGGLNAPVMDSTISVINPLSLMEEEKITVGLNPGKLVFANGYLYVHQRGNYGTVPSRLKKIDVGTKQIVYTSYFSPVIVESFSDKLLVAYEESQQIKLGTFSFSDTWINTNFISVSDIETLYNVQYESQNQHLYLFDARGYTVTGQIREYSNSGTLLKSYEVGLNPNSLIYFP